MSERTERRWAWAVRALALISIAAGATAILEGRAIRELRGDLEALRGQRETAKRSVIAQWAAQPVEDAGTALRALDEFYADPTDGWGRRGGLCADGKLNDRAIESSVFGTFLSERAAGKTLSGAIDAMRDAIRRTDAYRHR
jgi:hypothetical protein